MVPVPVHDGHPLVLGEFHFCQEPLGDFPELRPVQSLAILGGGAQHKAQELAMAAMVLLLEARELLGDLFGIVPHHILAQDNLCPFGFLESVPQTGNCVHKGPSPGDHVLNPSTFSLNSPAISPYFFESSGRSTRLSWANCTNSRWHRNNFL